MQRAPTTATACKVQPAKRGGGVRQFIKTTTTPCTKPGLVMGARERGQKVQHSEQQQQHLIQNLASGSGARKHHAWPKGPTATRRVRHNSFPLQNRQHTSTRARQKAGTDRQTSSNTILADSGQHTWQHTHPNTELAQRWCNGMPLHATRPTATTTTCVQTESATAEWGGRCGHPNTKTKSARACTHVKRCRHVCPVGRQEKCPHNNKPGWPPHKITSRLSV